MAKKRYKEITFDEYDLPHIELLAGEKYSMSDLHMLIVLMELETNRRLTLHAPDAALCSACGLDQVYENGLCWNCLPG